MSRRRGSWRRWLRRAVAALLVLVIVTTAGVFLLLRASLPSYDGEATVAGLTGSVTVVRDRNAVPHIFATNLADAYRALGYVHAQDRFFQMEMNRRFGAGRLAEIVGEPALRVDRLVRTLGIHRQAEESLAVLSPDARTAIEAYGQGVNAWLADAGLDLPPELRVLRVAPEPWRPTDTAAWGQLMAMRLAANWRTEVLRARLTDRLTAEQLRDLWPRDPPGRSATLPDLAALYRELDLDALAQAIPKVTTAGSASNEWVVAGRHTESGKPLLANDPHLGFEAPGLWYLARIVTPELEIAGATVPGVPLTILGHNGRIAWGMTNTEADVQDLFVERLDPSDPGRYMTPEGSEPFAVRVEEIVVRGRDAPVRLRVRSTRHGPVISDLGDRTGALPPEGHVLALAFAALEPGDTTAEALYRINRATNWESFVAALSHYRAPMQNIAYADVDGSIGFYAPALVPVRRNGDGFMPMPGWIGDFDWTGFIPFAELPQSVNPTAGRIVNANNRLVGAHYPHDIAAEWRWSYRADRINELLDTTAPHTTRTFAAIQTDIVSQAAVELVPKLLEAARDATAPAGADARRLDEAFRILERWNGAMDRDSVEPLLYMAWLRALGPALYADELGDLASEYYG
ncbi:MAG: penicillin acylase family protein, partial [Alphaproteobacteria bacterium]